MSTIENMIMKAELKSVKGEWNVIEVTSLQTGLKVSYLTKEGLVEFWARETAKLNSGAVMKFYDVATKVVQ